MGKYLKKHKASLIISMIMVALLVASMLIQPKILEIVIRDGISNVGENGVPQPDLDIVDKYGMYLIIMAAIGLVAGIINTVLAARVAQSIGAEVRTDIFTKIQKLSFSDIEKFQASNLVVRMTNDVNQVQSLIVMALQQLIRIPLLFIGAFVLAVLVFPSLWWIIIVEVVLVLLVLAFVQAVTFPSFGKYQKMIEGINARVKDNFIGARVVKSFVQEEDEIAKFTKQSDKLKKLNFKIGRNFSVIMPLFNLIGNVAVVVAIYFGASFVVDDMSLLGGLVSYTNYLFMIMFSLIIGGFLFMMAGRAAVSIGRIKEILEYEPEVIFTSENDVTLFDDLEFKNVSFKYHGDSANALHNISFKVKKGQTIGIVGATGSGKSTLINLIARLFSPQEGEITIGGTPINTINKERFADELSIVLQKPYLFSGTIKTNILDGKLSANDQEVEDSAKIAQAEEFIKSSTLTYDSLVQQRGSNYSGGQKQRISIARGLIKQPSILILDDSTSALDAKSEKLVKEGLDANYSNSTKFIVSQKISSVVNADQIIVLDEGRIDSIGTHKELVKNSKVYQEIFESQKGSEN